MSQSLYNQLMLQRLGQMGQEGQSGRAALIQRMGAAATDGRPVYSFGAALAKALSGGLAGYMSAREDERRAGERNQLIKGVMNSETKRAQNMRDLGARLMGQMPAPAAAAVEGAAPTMPAAPQPAMGYGETGDVDFPGAAPPTNRPPPSPVRGTPLPPPDLMPAFEQASRETGIPVPVLIAVARQESNFNPAARGGAGEIGIMQVKPSTAQQPGFGVAGVDPNTLADPAQNILFGARYLAARAPRGIDWNNPEMLATALRSYNGGGDPDYVSNVTRWMPQPQAPAGAAPPGGAAMPVATQQPPQQAPGINMAEVQRALLSGDPDQIAAAQNAMRLEQLRRQQNQPGPTERLVGPQGDGIYERTPQGLRLIGRPPPPAPDATQRVLERWRELTARGDQATPAEVAERDILARRLQGSGTNVVVNGERSFADRLAGKAADRIDTLDEQAGQAVQAIERADRIADLLESGVITGTGAEARLSVERLLRTAGMIDGRRVVNTEQLMTELATGTLAASGQLSGPTSDRDILFLREVAAGRIDLTPETIARAAGVARNIAERTVTRFNDIATTIQGDERLPASVRELYRPRSFPTRAPRAAPPATPAQGGGWSIQPVP